MQGYQYDSLSLFTLLQTPGKLDPYPLYQRLRSKDPVHWDPIMKSWVVSRYRDVIAALQDTRLSEKRVKPFFRQLSGAKQAEMAPLAEVLSNMMLFQDAPDHTRLRGAVLRTFTPIVIRATHERIQALSHELIDPHIAVGTIDIVNDFSLPLSAAVIADLLNVPATDRHKFCNWSSILKGFFTQSTTEVARVLDLKTCFQRIVAQSDLENTTGILAALLKTKASGALSFDEVFAIYLLLFDAGQVTTANLIGNGFLALLRHPEQFERLFSDRSLLPMAVAEMMRYDGPVQFTSRVAAENLVIGDRTVREGEGVILLLGAANRDPEQFPNADSFDVGRKENRHVGFGFGAHYCLGASLSLLEAQIAFGALLDRFPQPRLRSPAIWQQNLNFRFLSTLQVAFDSTRALAGRAS